LVRYGADARGVQEVADWHGRLASAPADSDAELDLGAMKLANSVVAKARLVTSLVTNGINVGLVADES